MKTHSTHYEHIVGTDYNVIIQHCLKCDVYLGVNYPSDYCDKHRSTK